MYDRSNMHRAATYSYSPQYAAAAAPQAPPPKHYPTAHSTSSAFSASANPNEDWTKISDLAERRRIQNRIAQRNYRKKLKKRLEDLERRAGSSSASPEQSHEELAQPETSQAADHPTTTGAQRQRSTSSQLRRDRTPEVLAQHYVLPSDDRGMFSQQYTRQLSTSPPPFSYASVPSAENTSYSTYPPAAAYCAIPSNNMDVQQMYPHYLPPIHQQGSYHHMVPSMSSPPIKQEFYHDDEMSPFSMSYATMAGVDVAAAQSYHDVAAYTPPLSDSFDHSQAGSPPDETVYPRTPASMPRTPPMRYERA